MRCTGCSCPRIMTQQRHQLLAPVQTPYATHGHLPQHGTTGVRSSGCCCFGRWGGVRDAVGLNVVKVPEFSFCSLSMNIVGHDRLRKRCIKWPWSESFTIDSKIPCTAAGSPLCRCWAAPEIRGVPACIRSHVRLCSSAHGPLSDTGFLI
jgi:hypothetical protein